MTAQLAAELAAKESWRLSRWLLVNGIEYLRLNMMKLNIDCFQLLNQNISKYDVENGNVLHFPESRAAAAGQP